MLKYVCCAVVVCSALLALPVEGRSVFLEVKQPQIVVEKPAPQVPKKDYPLYIFKIKYNDADSIYKTIKGILAVDEGISVDQKLNTILVRASEKTVKRIAEIIKKIDTVPLQVQVEARVIEVMAGEVDRLEPPFSANWKVSNPKDSNDYAEIKTSDTLNAGASSLGLYAQVIGGNVEAYLSALEKTTGYDLVASPWITAVNHEEAEILIGSKYGYRTSIIAETSTVQEVNFLEVGTKLKFTPHINDDGYIRMEIEPSISEGSVVDDLPQETTTQTRNKVVVKDGQTIVIGGLTKKYSADVEIGVPLLAHLPLIGGLFRRKETNTEKKDVMILITPHIITPEFLEKMAEKARALENKN